jgi:TonB family protein
MSNSTAVRPQRDPSASDSATPESARRGGPLPGDPAPPALLCELEPWHRVFLRNLGDLLLHRQPPPIEITAQPVALRPVYFIRTGIDAYRFAQSYAGHIAFVIVVYLVCTLPLFNRPPKLQSPFENTKVEYYPVSEYLPPINTASEAPVKPRQGAPKLAKQEILSVPPEPDNTHQTIVTPPKVKLDRDVPLPNIVAWTPIPAAQPIAASARSVSQLKVPQFETQVVAPTADVSQLKSKLQLPTLPQPSVVEPPLSPDQLKLQKGELNMAQLQPQVAAPKLPVPAQRASGVGDNGAKNVPPSPNVQNLPATQGQGQLIALGLSPTDVRGPITVPSGNRSGEFHASPGGKPDAPGTPNVVGTGNDASGGTGRDAGNGLPPGIMIGAPPPGAATSAVAGAPSKPSASNPDMEARKRMIAAAMRPSLPSYHDRQPPAPPPTLSDDPGVSIERRVFRAKPYYSLVMNMPNLTSVTGSWIIRFAELKESTDKGLLTAPVATTKVDPAYPPDVLRDHVEGTVTLYAVIRADGTVDGIKVLDSLDSRLDANAMRALSGWHFRPGTKNGEPVALEAVVQIPFRMRHLQ